MRLLAVVVAIAGFTLFGPGSAPPPAPSSAEASTLPSGFEEVTVFSGLTNPTVVRFAVDGRVFVAEKSGLIKVFDNLLDTTPTTFADLRTNVNNYWDRGLLGMALAPGFPTTPYVYVLYAYDHQLGSASAPPRWNDACPTPPGPTTDGCVVSGRLSRLQASGNVMTGPEQVLVEDWCQQYPSHSVGTVEFGPDGALYASGGDGASFNFVDYGQDGNPLNPCGDPPGGVGATLTPPTAEGGALRSQDVRTTGDPTGLDGSIIRVDPTTGAAMPDNPNAGSSDANARRIIAHGFRNPFRFTFRPGTSEIWIGDVGWNDWEEINRITSPTDATVENFGWPCYEGNPKQAGYDAAGLNLCSSLSPSAVSSPYFAYHHSNKVVTGESCPTGSSSIAGLAFEFAPTTSSYPPDYQGALFFADYTRDCIWVMKKSGNPIPSPGHIDTFAAAAANPVNLEFGPDGNLYYVDFDGGTIRRIQPTSPPPSSAYLSDLNWTSMTNGWGPVEKDQSNGEQGTGDGLPLTLNGTTYPKGLGTHAASDVRYSLGANCTRFKASVGIDDEVASFGSVVFQVFADTTQVYDSGVMTSATATKTVDVSIAGAAQLRLVVTNGGDTINYDHGDWALARIECGGGGGGSPPPFAPAASLPSGTNAHGVTMADLNGDQILDLVAANAGASTASVWLGIGNGTFGARATFATGQTPKQISVGDLNGDGRPDLVSANQDAASVSVLLGNGSGGFGAKVDYPACAGTHETALGDFNGNGTLDVIAACHGGSVASVLLGNGNGTLAAKVDYATGAAPHSVVVGNFDADGALDAAVANHDSNSVSILRGNGNGTFQPQVAYAVGSAPHSIRAGDLDGDGRPDLVTANEGSNNVSVLRGNGNGTFAAAVSYATGLVPKGVAIADVSGDGRLDVLTANTAGSYPNCCNPGGDQVSILLGTGGSVLGSPTSYTVGQTPFAVVAGDLDRDGDLDIATANWHSNDVTVRLNQTTSGGDTTPPTVTGRTPAPGATGVALGVSPTATFSEAMSPASLTTTTFTLVKQGTSTPVAATVSYASQVATLDPSANLDPSSTYTATVKGGASGAKDVAGNPLAADVTWTFTTGTGQTTTTYLSDLSWTSAVNGWGPVEKDESNGDSAAGDGQTLTLNGATFAKGLGTHAASDVRYAVSSCSRFLASVGVDDEVGTFGSVVFQVFADATKVYDSGSMTGATATKTVDVSIAGATQLRLVVTNGGDNINYDHGDWALARIECGGGGGDTTPPTVTGRTPAPGATGVALGVSPTATFSEAMSPASLTTTTFTLVKQGTSTPVAATVSYASQVATLDPSANLDPSSTYTATVKGGASGAKDVAGNPLAADVTWTFTTTAGANQAPTAFVDTPSSTLTWKVGDSISFTGHATDPEQGTLPTSALTWRLLLQHCPSNCHTHVIQTWPGVASGSFSAPDHEYPSYLDLELTATDSGGATGTTTVRLDPKTVVLTFGSSPSGLQLSVNASASTTSFTRTVIVGSANSVSAVSPQDLGGTTYNFQSWSDGGAQTHNIVAPATPATYTATYQAGGGGPPSTYLSDLSWTSAVNGWGPVEKDESNGDSAAGDGQTLTLNGATFAKGLGTHAASDVRYALGGSCSRFKASVGIDDEVGTFGSVVFQVFADATKVYDSGSMTGATATKTVDVSIAGATQLRLVVTNGGDNINYDHGDWALARIECSTDSTPPTVTQTTPAGGATGVAVDTTAIATFSEAMDPATLTTTTFTLLQQGSQTPLQAGVSYDVASRTATLTPSASLLPGTSYTATVRGGSSGAKDLAGNPLAADVTWNFQTATQQPTSTYLSDLSWTAMTNGWGPVEKDQSNGESGTGDGATLTLNGTTYARGLGAHAASDVRYALGATCTRFKASVGVDDEVGVNGSVTFEVYAGTTKVYDSGTMTGTTATKTVDVSVAGASELRLVVTDGGDGIGYDHGDWALARIEC